MMMRRPLYDNDGAVALLLTDEHGDQYVQKTDGTTLRLTDWATSPTRQIAIVMAVTT